jgi:hypothetical protein
VKELKREAAWAEDRGWYVRPGESYKESLFPDSAGIPNTPLEDYGSIEKHGVLESGADPVGVDCSGILEEGLSRHFGWSAREPLALQPQPVLGSQRQLRLVKKGFLEVFAGLGHLSSWMLRSGCPWVEPWDNHYSPHMSLTSI